MKSILALLLLPSGAALAQGTFPPPSGPTVPIMKTLNQVEPRRPLAGGTTSVSIIASGAYYLTGNITVSTDSGLNISASNVTVDLNGYTISSTAASATGRGIFIAGGSSNVEIYNGNIRGTTTFNGASFQTIGGFNRGITAFPNAKNLSIHEINIDGIGGDGITFDGNSGFDSSSVTNCNITATTGTGIRAANVRNCSLTDVGGAGILANVAIDCLVIGRTTSAGLSAISADVVTDCYATNASGPAIFSNGNVTNSFGLSTASNGINALTVTGSLGLTGATLPAIQSNGIVNHSRGQGAGISISGDVVVASTGAGGTTVSGSSVKQFSSP